MITAIDTNILHDVLTGDRKFGIRSADALHHCLAQGAVVACEIVWTETAAFFPKHDVLVEVMRELNITFSDITLDTALEAGRIWRAYRTRGGRRQRVAADFLIGAHATLQADRLLTRDRGFYRDYFSKLRLIDPGTRA